MSQQNTSLVINCGSTSVKFAIMNPEDGHVYLSGIAEALYLPEAFISWKFENGEKQKAGISNADHEKALDFLVETILDGKNELKESIKTCGHRIVHGGEFYSAPTLIDDEVVANIEKIVPFAPIHNPANILGIKSAKRSFPNIPHVAVFDTAFHQTMPPRAYRFAIPEELYTEKGIRRYGFHGTSHMYLSRKVAEIMNKNVEDLNVITCHLGGGASIAAIKGGKCMDTSMGLTPLDGLIMGTRSGSIDPSVVFFLCNRMNKTPNEVKDILNKQSGLLAISNISSDMRPICEGYLKGDEKCVLAMEMFCYTLAKYIMAYHIPLGRVDAIIFAGGIGENCYEARELTCQLLEQAIHGLKIDYAKNKETLARLGIEYDYLSTEDSTLKVMMIATNEELVIARSANEFKK